MIEKMDQWDVEEETEELQPFIEFECSDTGQFQFGCVNGQIDCRLTQRDGQPAVEFTWDGNDETEHVFGRGWPVLDGDELLGMIFFHFGDESGFTARQVEKKIGCQVAGTGLRGTGIAFPHVTIARLQVWSDRGWRARTASSMDRTGRSTTVLLQVRRERFVVPAGASPFPIMARGVQ